MARYGMVELITVDERTTAIVAGHGRLDTLLARRGAGKDAPEGVQVTDDGRWLTPVSRGWASATDEDFDGYLITSNRATEAGGWDNALLATMLTERAEAGIDGVTGFTSTDVDELLASLRAERDARDDEDPPEAEKSDGSLLALADVTVGEPRQECHRGQVWRLGHHHLIVDSIITGWELFVPYLQPGALLVPYPGVYVSLSLRADERPLVMVQPSPYIAGHVIDKWVANRGEDSIELVAEA